MYAVQLFDTQMYRHMEAICPETSLEQRAMALASTRIHPAEVAGAPVIGYLPHGAPIIVVRGMAVACKVRVGMAAPCAMAVQAVPVIECTRAMH
jgi:hypothetical protein